MVYYPSPDGFIVALDARTGEVRWETKTTGGMTAGAVVVEGKVLSGRTCAPPPRELLHLGARREDRRGGLALLHRGRRRTSRAARPGAARQTRRASLRPGACPAATTRCGGSSTGASPTRCRTRGPIATAGTRRRSPTSSPADLYSNSTVALHLDTGKLAWYYQHLPGDDWDEDYPHERTLIRTAVRPNPKFVKWINPDVRRGRERDVAVNGRRGRRHLGARPRDGAVPVGHPVSRSTRRTSSSRTSTARPARVRAEQERDVHRAAGSAGDLLLEHAQLLADGVPSGPQRAVRALRRELPGHDVGRAGSASRAERRLGIPREGVGPRTHGRG